MALLHNIFENYFHSEEYEHARECANTLKKSLDSYLYRASEDILISLLEIFPVPVMVRHKGDKNKNIINFAFTQTFGYNIEDVANLRQFYEKIYPDPSYRQTLISEFQILRQSIQQSGISIKPMDVSLVCKEGRKKDCELHFIEIESFSIAVFIDITIRKKLERQLFETSANLETRIQNELKKRASQARLVAAIFHSNAAGITLTDNQGVILEANNRFGEMFGYTPEELIGHPFTILVPEHLQEITLKAHNEDFSHQEKMPGSEWQCLHKNGSLIDVHVSHGYVEDEKGKPLQISIVQDITEIVRLRAEQKRQETLLIQQSKMASMGEMIGAIGHQWRQPLNALAVRVQDISDAFAYGDLNSAYIQTFIDKAMQNINFMSQTIEDFRNFFSPHKITDNFSLEKASQEVYMMVHSQFYNNDIAVEIHLNNNEDLIISGHENEFKQVMLNLLINAKDQIISLIAKDQIAEENKKVIINITKIEDQTHVSVQDFAGGIPSNLLSTIFESGFTTKGDNGTGIGLYMSKLIAEESFGGQLTVTNQNGGACFTLILPIS